MTDAYQNRIPSAVPKALIRCDRVGLLPRLQVGFLGCMNDTLNGAGAEDFLQGPVFGEHAVVDAVEESAELPKELLARSRAKLRRPSRACCSKQRAGEL